MKNGVNLFEIEKIIKELQKFSTKIITFNPPLKDDSVVRKFECQYGIQLPHDYKELIKHFDGFDLMGTQVLGFCEKYNIIEVYRFEHDVQWFGKQIRL